ncbi:peptide deformylase [Verrucomicrobia bacterium]|nr:peptide deformylase [Verrucomicrobiota bacterium]
MVLPIVNYGDPVLRQRGEQIAEVTPEITKLIEDMVDTMEEAAGIGLAAQQIGKAIQLTVVDVSEVTDRSSAMFIDGKEVDFKEYMPMVLINPVLKTSGKREEGPEGCLSFPEIYEEVMRPIHVEVKALNGKGEPLHFKAEGLLSRCIQHETDHLNGILFIDRMIRDAKLHVKKDVDALFEETRKELGIS